MIDKAFKYLQVFCLLGPSWVLFRLRRVFLSKSGYWNKKTPMTCWGRNNPVIIGRFWNMTITSDLSQKAIEILNGQHRLFSRHKIQTGRIPDWFAAWFAQKITDSDYSGAMHWSKISDFASSDIKGVWELSRFAWVYPLIWAWETEKNQQAVDLFWDLVEDWAAHNPPNTGVHWKCGQETAIRMFALISGYFAFKDNSATTRERSALLGEIVLMSGRRIDANIKYALSQKNNHGVSEAAGLFTAGVMLDNEPWMQRGRKLLEKQALELIYEDGSFSQHSVNYHRVMLHAYLWAIGLAKANDIVFKGSMLDRIGQAGQWLKALCDPQTGRCPNLGANDGALVFPVTACDYLDYRPTVQAVGVVVDKKKWMEAGPWDGLACFLGYDTGVEVAETKMSIACPGAECNENASFVMTRFDSGGYIVFADCDTRLLFHCPASFRHRPAQCDLLHVDLFHHGVNVLRDAGTYSYNCEQPWQDYFESSAAHNTVQFDDHDQMPRLSRFLLGKWPKPDVAADISALKAKCGFTDWKGCVHERTVQAGKREITIVDEIWGFEKKAVLRWRLAPDADWSLDGLTCSSRLAVLKIQADTDISSVKIVQGWESLYYHERTRLPVLEVTVDMNCRKIVSEIALKPVFS